MGNPHGENLLKHDKSEENGFRVFLIPITSTSTASMSSRNAFNKKFHDKANNVGSERRLSTAEQRLDDPSHVIKSSPDSKITQNRTLNASFDIEIKSAMSGVADVTIIRISKKFM